MQPLIRRFIENYKRNTTKHELFCFLLIIACVAVIGLVKGSS